MRKGAALAYEKLKGMAPAFWSSILGTVVGIIPAGASINAFVAYGRPSGFRSTPRSFGHGSYEAWRRWVRQQRRGG
jgi:TctA family transporter